MSSIRASHSSTTFFFGNSNLGARRADLLGHSFLHHLSVLVLRIQPSAPLSLHLLSFLSILDTLNFLEHRNFVIF